MNNYYVYFHINPVKNKIFYVGMGSGNRAYKYGRNQHWERVVKKYGWIVDIIEEGLTQEEAKEREKFYIKKIGRQNLTNMTDGGDGDTFTGRKHSEESKKKMSEVKKGKIASKITRSKMSESHKGRKHSEESKKKISLGRLGKDNPMYGKKPHNIKKIINIETGEIYDSIKLLANKLGYNYQTLVQYLNGRRKNKTPFQYYNPSN